LDTDIGDVEKMFRLLFSFICKLSTSLMWPATLCIPEMVLYPIIFGYILQATNSTAKAGILLPEVIRRRRQQTSLNIQVTVFYKTFLRM
jgi:hypothetical protein